MLTGEDVMNQEHSIKVALHILSLLEENIHVNIEYLLG